MNFSDSPARLIPTRSATNRLSPLTALVTGFCPPTSVTSLIKESFFDRPTPRLRPATIENNIPNPINTERLPWKNCTTAGRSMKLDGLHLQ